MDEVEVGEEPVLRNSPSREQATREECQLQIRRLYHQEGEAKRLPVVVSGRLRDRQVVREPLGRPLAGMFCAAGETPLFGTLNCGSDGTQVGNRGLGAGALVA